MLKVQKKMIDYQRYVRSYKGKAKKAQGSHSLNNSN